MATLTTPTIPASIPAAHSPMAASAIEAAMARSPNMDGCSSRDIAHQRTGAGEAARAGIDQPPQADGCCAPYSPTEARSRWANTPTREWEAGLESRLQQPACPEHHQPHGVSLTLRDRPRM